MAKIKTTTVSDFSLLPEGKTQFKIIKVDDSKYDKFGKLTIEMVTQNGQKHNENFGLIDAKGEINKGALKSWSYWIGAILGIWGEQEVDSDELVGHYFEADVTQEESDTISEKTGKPFVNNRLNNMTAIDGFAEGDSAPDIDDDEDVDDFLDD